MHKIWLLLLISPITLGSWICMTLTTRWRIRRKWRQFRFSDAEFLSGCGCQPNTPEAGFALRIREIIAGLAGLAPEQLAANTDFRELSDLKFWKHFDEILFFGILEKEFGVEFGAEFDKRSIGHAAYPAYNEKLTLNDFIHTSYRIYTEKYREQSARSRSTP